MGKNKNKKQKAELRVDGKSTVQAVTNSLNKHGEIRGDSKKETKNLKAMCPHHKVTKKGKIKPTVINDGRGTCICEMCGHRFPTKLYSSEDTHAAVDAVTTILDQARFMAEAADLGKDTKMYLARTSVDIAHLPKTYGKIRHVTEKNDAIKKHKKKNRGNEVRGGSESYGAWK